MQQHATPNSTKTRPTLPKGRAYDPWEHADALNLQVIVRPIRTANELWMPEFDTIVLRTGLRSAHQRVALAHGIGHAHYGHRDDRPKHERQADTFAAGHLIAPDELHDVAKWADDDYGIICAELGITHRVLAAYLRLA